MAAKAVCQVLSHGAKFLYFGGLVDQAVGLDPLMSGLAVLASMIGTSMARPILQRLSDVEYQQWASRIITAIAVVYLAHGSYLLFWPQA